MEQKKHLLDLISGQSKKADKELHEAEHELHEERKEIAGAHKRRKKYKRAKRRSKKIQELREGLMKSEHVGFKRLQNRVAKEYEKKGIGKRKAKEIGAKVAGKVKAEIEKRKHKK